MNMMKKISSKWHFHFKVITCTLRPTQNGHQFPDDNFKCIFLSENMGIFINIWLKFVPKGPIYNISALVQIMAWHRPGDEPLSEPLMVSLLIHICVTQPQWVKKKSGPASDETFIKITFPLRWNNNCNTAPVVVTIILMLIN